MCTMQAPHKPVPQPNLVPVSLRSSRITHSSGVAGGAAVEAALPFTVKLVAMLVLPDERIASSEYCYAFFRYSLLTIRFFSRQRRLHPHGVERQVANALAGGVGKGVAHRRDPPALPAFSPAQPTPL